MNDPVSILVSYSHEDDEYRRQLGVALASLLDEGKVTLWHDRRIAGGAEWDEAIKEQLATAEVILLLLSADFIASDYIRKVEIPAAIDRHHRGEAVVIPVFLRKFDYSPNAPFAKLQGYPTHAVPVDAWPKRDEAYYTVVQGIRAVVERILADRQTRAAKRQEARLRYRTKAKELLDDGVIDDVERDTLDELRDELALSAADIEQIEREESAPHRKKDAAKEKYRKTLVKVIGNGDQISDTIRASLDLRLRDLGLNAEDVERMETEVIQQAEARRTERHDEVTRPAVAAPEPARDAANPARRDADAVLAKAAEALKLDDGLLAGLTGAITTLTGSAERPSPPPPAPAEAPALKAGDAVQVAWKGRWWKASVLAVDGTRTRVHYDNWGSNWDEWVGPERIRR